MHSLLVASSSALALRACPPQLVASSSAARAARSPTTARRCALASSAARAARSPATARRTLLGARAARSPATARRTLLGARAARSPPRQLALRARSRCALARHSSSHAPRRSRCALASSAARAARSPVTARHKLLRWSSPFAPRGWPRVASFCSHARASNSARVQSSTAALRGRSSKLKCLERAAGAASSHGLPNHPHAQSHKLFDNCSPHLIGSGPQLS